MARAPCSQCRGLNVDPWAGTGSHVPQLKDLTSCNCVDHNKLWKIIRWEYQTTLPVSWETCTQVKKQQLEHGTTDWFKTGKGVHQDCILSSCLFNLYAESVCVLSCSVVSDSLQPTLPTRLLYPWEFSRQEYWTGLPCPPPGDLPNPGIKPRSPTLQVDSLPSQPSRKPKNTGIGSLSLLQQIFLTQELNQVLLHCRWILY